MTLSRPHIGEAQIRIGTSLGIAHVIASDLVLGVGGLLLAEQFDHR
jgi:hypothetical protein